MQSNNPTFQFGINFNLATDSVFVQKDDDNANFVPVEGNFELLDGTPFLLLDGTDFLLL